MHCPYCRSQDLKVIDSRDVEDGIRRRRECAACGERFTTYERPQIAALLVIKKDGRREEFTREKVLLGVRKACEKRPLAAGILEAIVDDIETRLHERAAVEVSSREIGEMVMEHLRGLDQIAYIRFASVYHQFADLDELHNEVDALEALLNAANGGEQPTLIPEEEMQDLSRPAAWRALRQRKRTNRTQTRQRGAASAAAGGAKGSASPPA